MSSRLAWGCVALAISSITGIAGTSVARDAPVAASADVSSPMHFTLFTDGSVEPCGIKCRPLIAASGMITADTARQFIAFVRDNALQAAQGSQAGVGATVVLESDGGSVLGALDLGRAIRRFGSSHLNHAVDRADDAVELRYLAGKLLAAGGGELVVPGATIAGGGAPLRGDPTLKEDALERGVLQVEHEHVTQALVADARQE